MLNCFSRDCSPPIQHSPTMSVCVPGITSAKPTEQIGYPRGEAMFLTSHHSRCWCVVKGSWTYSVRSGTCRCSATPVLCIYTVFFRVLPESRMLHRCGAVLSLGDITQVLSSGFIHGQEHWQCYFFGFFDWGLRYDECWLFSSALTTMTPRNSLSVARTTLGRCESVNPAHRKMCS